jgi:hypothetical protein
MKILCAILIPTILGCASVEEKPVDNRTYASGPYDRYVNASIKACKQEAFVLSFEMWMAGVPTDQVEASYRIVNEMCLIEKKLVI